MSLESPESSVRTINSQQFSISLLRPYHTEQLQRWQMTEPNQLSFNSIYALWQDPTTTDQDTRQKLVALMTAPENDDLLLKTPPNCLAKLLHLTETVNNFKTSSLRQRLQSKPHLAKELSLGILNWFTLYPSIVTKETSILDYQEAIHNLLPIIDDGIAEQLFTITLYHFKDQLSKASDEIFPSPTANLLFDQSIGRKYKDAILNEWYQTAHAESSNISDGKYNIVLNKMINFIEYWSLYPRLDQTVLTSMIAFLEQHITTNQSYLQANNVSPIAKQLNNEELKFLFVWRHYITGNQAANNLDIIKDDDDLKLVDWLNQQAIERKLSSFKPLIEKLKHYYQLRLARQTSLHYPLHLFIDTN